MIKQNLLIKGRNLAIVLVLMLSVNACKKSDNDAPKVYPKNGLVAYWNFDGNLKEISNLVDEGTNSGNATFTTGKNGNAITFSGNQYVEFDRKTFRSGNNVSVSLWFKSTTANPTTYFVMCNDFGVFTSKATAGMAISLPNTNSSSGTFTSDTWTHLVGTYDGTNIKTYINGVLAETVSHPGNISGVDSKLRLGKVATENWTGSVDDLFIYNKVLTQEEITQLYQY